MLKKRVRRFLQESCQQWREEICICSYHKTVHCLLFLVHMMYNWSIFEILRCRCTCFSQIRTKSSVSLVTNTSTLPTTFVYLRRNAISALSLAITTCERNNVQDLWQVWYGLRADRRWPIENDAEVLSPSLEEIVRVSEDRRAISTEQWRWARGGRAIDLFESMVNVKTS